MKMDSKVTDISCHFNAALEIVTKQGLFTISPRDLFLPADAVSYKRSELSIETIIKSCRASFCFRKQWKTKRLSTVFLT